MKISEATIISIIFITVYVLSGCAVTFNKDEYIEYVVNDHGINASNVKYIYGVGYTVTSNTSYKGVWKWNNVLVATDTALILYTDQPSDKKPDLVLNLPYTEIKGFACWKLGTLYQIQILGDLGIVAIYIENGGFFYNFDNVTKTHQLCNYIRGKEVPEVKNTKLITTR